MRSLVQGVRVNPVVFVDFDGTITRTDTTDAILEAYADPRWRALEEAWVSGRIGSRDCLRDQMALVDAAPEEIDALLDDIDIDEGFVSLFETCASYGVALHIVSDSFDYCINRVLGRAGHLSALLEGVTISSSHLEPHGRSWRAHFGGAVCDHGCATCKPATMGRLNPGRGPVVFVGDGYSDRHAAAVADLLYAKGALVHHCNAHRIPYVSFEDLAAVALEFDQMLRDEHSWKGRDLLYD